MADETKRWNFEQRDDGLYFCDGGHGKSEGCEFQLVTEEVFRSAISLACLGALREASDAVCWCNAGKVSGYHIAECPAAQLRELKAQTAGEVRCGAESES